MHKVKFLLSMSLAMTLLLMGSTWVSAAPMTWSLDIDFSDGGEATGSFDYDALSNTFTNVAVTTTAGTIRSGSSYSDPTGIGTSTIVDFIDPELPVIVFQSERLDLFLAAPMTDAGGTIAVLAVHEFFCIDFACTFVSGNEPGLDLRLARAGFITTLAAVPEPTTLALLGIGLAGLAFRRRKRP